MIYITSRGYPLPTSPQIVADSKWFNLWSKRLWPYAALESGNRLAWYESANKSVVWQSTVADVRRFSYVSKDEVRQSLDLSPEEASQPYFTGAPSSGYCLSYRVANVQRASILKPEGYRFPQLGWLKVDEEALAQWPLLGAITAGTHAEVA